MRIVQASRRDADAFGYLLGSVPAVNAVHAIQVHTNLALRQVLAQDKMQCMHNYTSDLLCLLSMHQPTAT